MQLTLSAGSICIEPKHGEANRNPQCAHNPDLAILGIRNTCDVECHIGLFVETVMGDSSGRKFDKKFN